jgi:hypothetical protein
MSGNQTPGDENGNSSLSDPPLVNSADPNTSSSLRPEIQGIIAHLHVHKHLTENEVDKLLRVYDTLKKDDPAIATAWINEVLVVGQHQRESENKIIDLARYEAETDRVRLISSVTFSAFAIFIIVGLIGWLAYLGYVELAASVIAIATAAIGLSKIIASQKKQKGKTSYS